MPTEYVTVGRTSAGAHGRAAPGEPVEVPVDALEGSRGLIIGAPDAGIDESTTILADALLSAGQSVLLVDADGSYRDLASNHGVRLAGGDPDCDVRVSRGNADRIATLVGEDGESVVLDCSSFDSASGEVVGAIADAIADDRRKRASLVVILTACHEWLPDAGESVCADALADLGRTDSAPGVGVVGVTDRPAGVDSGFRQDCDWIAAHRVTWREHVDAVARILGRSYDDAIESLDDGEALLDGPWAGAVERVRFERQEPGRRTRSRRESDSDATRARVEDRQAEDTRSDPGVDLAELSRELADVAERLDELEDAIADRDDVETIAGDIADAIAGRLDDRERTAPDPTASQERSTTDDPVDADQSSSPGRPEASDDGGDTDSGGFGTVFDAFDDAGGATAGSSTGQQTASSTERAASTSTESSESAAADDRTNASSTTDSTRNGSDSGGMSFEPANFAFDEAATGGETSPDGISTRRSRSRSGERRVPRYVRDLVRTVEEMDPTTRKMLAHYVDRGADTPMNAHFSAGGPDDRTSAYAHNRQLRTTGFVEHVGRGHYAPTIPEKVREEADSGLSTEAVKKATEHVRRALP